MDPQRHDIIVIGTSAGGFQAISNLLSQLPPNLPAAIFLVVHLSSENSGKGLLNYFKKHTSLQCRIAKHDEKIEYGRVYIAPPDYHMLLKQNQIIISKGATENKYRPSIDHLFRSAAAAYGSRTIGVILTGMLEDGTSGMTAIKRSGGITVIQNPEEAVFSDMPLSVISNVEVDHVLPISEMGSMLNHLIYQPAFQLDPVPADVLKEAEIAERVLLGIGQVEDSGELTPITCPDCGGSLWRHSQGELIRYRCHTGHSFSEGALLKFKSDEIEETMWVVLRMLEEKKNILKLMGERSKTEGGNKWKVFNNRAEESEVHIQRVREILLNIKPLPDLNSKPLNDKNASKDLN